MVGEVADEAVLQQALAQNDVLTTAMSRYDALLAQALSSPLQPHISSPGARACGGQACRGKPWEGSAADPAPVRVGSMSSGKGASDLMARHRLTGLAACCHS